MTPGAAGNVFPGDSGRTVETPEHPKGDPEFMPEQPRRSPIACGISTPSFRHVSKTPWLCRAGVLQMLLAGCRFDLITSSTDNSRTPCWGSFGDRGQVNIQVSGWSRFPVLAVVR